MHTLSHGEDRGQVCKLLYTKLTGAGLMQGFYLSMAYHSFSIKYGGHVSVLDEAAWLAHWVALMQQVLESDVCKVSRTASTGMHSVHSRTCLVVVIRSWLGTNNCSHMSPD